MLKMKNLIFIINLFIGVYVFSQEHKTIETTFFSEVKVFDAITVNLIQSDENKVVVYGEDKDQVVVVNNDGRLKVRMTFGKIQGGKETHVDVYYSKVLELIDANEGAFISSSGVIKQVFLNLRSQEGGEIDLDVDVTKLEVKTVTGGKIEVNGNAVNQEVIISTGGVYNAIELQSEQAKVSITSGGSANITTSEYVEAKVNIGGTIKIYGRTKVIEKTTFLGGVIMEM